MTSPGLIEAARAAGAVSQIRARTRDSARLWAKVLSEVPLFAYVGARHLRSIAAQGTIVRFEPGSTIVRTGQPGDAFYVVLDGMGSVVRRRGLPRVPIETGSYFGELALLDGEPRSATVRADTEMTCLRLGRNVFLKVLKDEPSVSLALLRTLSARLRDRQAEHTD
jgi:CRP-like cAMP-binding protein